MKMLGRRATSGLGQVPADTRNGRRASVTVNNEMATATVLSEPKAGRPRDARLDTAILQADLIVLSVFRIEGDDVSSLITHQFPLEQLHEGRHLLQGSKDCGRS